MCSLPPTPDLKRALARSALRRPTAASNAVVPSGDGLSTTPLMD